MENLNKLPDMPVPGDSASEEEVKTIEDAGPVDKSNGLEEKHNKTEVYKTTQEGINYLVVQQEVALEYSKINSSELRKSLLKVIKDFEQMDESEAREVGKEISKEAMKLVSNLSAFRESAGKKIEESRNLAEETGSFEATVLERVNILINKIQEMNVDEINQENALDIYTSILHVQDVFMGVSLVNLKRDW